MNLHLLENDDLKEIVFETRNKAYGAYQLRSDYHRTLNRAMMFTLLSFSLFVGIIVFIHKLTKESVIPDVMKTEPHVFRNFEVEYSQIIVETKPAIMPINQTTPLENNYKVVEIVKSANNTTATQTSQATTGSETGTVAVNSTNITTSGNPGNIIAEVPTTPIELAMLDVSPEFPGGIEKFYKYLLRKLEFSGDARNANLSGKYYASFIINPDGKIVSVKMLRAIGYGMDEHVTAILNESPAWKPGYYHGQPVSTVIRLPINFQMLQ